MENRNNCASSNSHSTHNTHPIIGRETNGRFCKDCQVFYYDEFAKRQNEEDYNNKKMFDRDAENYRTYFELKSEIAKHSGHKTEFSSLFHRYCTDCKVWYEDYQGNAKEFNDGKFSVFGLYGDGRVQSEEALKNIEALTSNIKMPFEVRNKSSKP